MDGDRAVAVTWTERAGREAMRLHAYEEGRRWYGQALALGAGVLDDAHRCRLMIAYASAQCLSSDFTAALETCLHAVELAVRVGRPDLAAEAAMVPEPTFDERIDRLIRALCERALAVLGRCAGFGSGAFASPVRLGLRPPLRPGCGPPRH